MYKIKVKKTGMGWECTLYKKVWRFFWTKDTTAYIKFGCEYLIEETIGQWIKNFNIPENLIDGYELIGTDSKKGE